MQLLSINVVVVTMACHTRTPEPKDIIVSGIRHEFAFDWKKIEENKDMIAALLNELPDEFKTSSGGGQSIYKMRYDRRGNQWTDSPLQVEALCCLGIAAGKAKWYLPQELWHTLPDRMPYFTVLED